MSCCSVAGRVTSVTTMLSRLLTVPRRPPTSPPSRLFDAGPTAWLALTSGALGMRSLQPTARALTMSAALTTPRRRFRIENLLNALGRMPGVPHERDQSLCATDRSRDRESSTARPTRARREWRYGLAAAGACDVDHVRPATQV